MDCYPDRKSIYKDSTCELVMFEWKENDFIPEHDHPNIKCYFMVLKGTLVEKRCNGEMQLIRYDNCFKYIEDNFEKHCVKALEPSVSIHLYINKTYFSKL